MRLCFVDFAIQHAKRIRNIIFSFVAFLALPYILSLLQIQAILLTRIEHIMCLSISVQTLLETFVILRRTDEIFR